jgi:hypothetical protein
MKMKKEKKEIKVEEENQRRKKIWSMVWDKKAKK